MGENKVNMSAIENKVTWVVLFVGLGLIALGYVIAGFLLAVGMTLLLGSRTTHHNSSRPQSFSMPDESWSVACEEHNVPVRYCALAVDNVMRFMAGQAQEVELKEEEEAQSGQHLSVYGRWTDSSGCQQQRKLGHIPAQEVKGLYSETNKRPECRVSAKISEIFVPTKGNEFPGLALDIAVLEPSS